MLRKQSDTPTKHCLRCSQVLERKRFSGRLEDFGRFSKRMFCSLRCANSRGVASLSSSSQHRISAQFRKDKCDCCGNAGGRTLHVHHLNGIWTDHRIENLQTLCHSCHMKVHHPKSEKQCSVNGCGFDSRKYGMCSKHFQRFKKYGDPSLTKVRIKGTLNQHGLTKEDTGLRSCGLPEMPSCSSLPPSSSP